MPKAFRRFPSAARRTQRPGARSGQAHAIRREVNALCAELRPLAVPLVGAFAIPDKEEATANTFA